MLRKIGRFILLILAAFVLLAGGLILWNASQDYRTAVERCESRGR